MINFTVRDSVPITQARFISTDAIDITAKRDYVSTVYDNMRMLDFPKCLCYISVQFLPYSRMVATSEKLDLQNPLGGTSNPNCSLIYRNKQPDL